MGTAVGANALDANTTGAFNTGIGKNALGKCTTGSNNTSIGEASSPEITTGGDNTACGVGALDDATTGSHNVAVGRAAGSSLTTGSSNTFIGYNAGTSSGPGGAITTGSNTVVIGDNNSGPYYVRNSFTVTSDERDKTDITTFTKGLDIVNALRPVTYKWDMRSNYDDRTPDGTKKGTSTEIGLIAQEVLTVEKANGYASSNDDSLIVDLSQDGDHYGLKYERLVPILVNAIKELSAEVTALKAA